MPDPSPGLTGDQEAASSGPERLLAFKPKLPQAAALLPYLRQIDGTRVYSNYGPLVMSFQDRLATLFDVPPHSVLVTNSGTAALAAGILAQAGWATAERPYALCPAYTFIATAHAVRQCGYEPYIADVCASSWMLDPDALEDHPMLERIGLVMPVSAYGRPLEVDRWARFQERTGVPVVIDAAAAFEAVANKTILPSDSIPVALSFHATKSFGCGEGGCLIWLDKDRLLDAAQATNFGFMGSRNCEVAGFNGKMSEYHAAVGLAELDDWDTKRLEFGRSVEAYHLAFNALGMPAEDLVTAPLIASNYVLYDAKTASRAARIGAALDAAAIDSRLWYGHGLHHHDYLKDARRDALTVTEQLGSSLLGLPMGIGLKSSQVERVAHVLSRS